MTYRIWPYAEIDATNNVREWVAQQQQHHLAYLSPLCRLWVPSRTAVLTFDLAAGLSGGHIRRRNTTPSERTNIVTLPLIVISLKVV